MKEDQEREVVKREVVKREITNVFLICMMAMGVSASLASAQSDRGLQAPLQSSMDSFFIDVLDADLDATISVSSVQDPALDLTSTALSSELSASLEQLADLANDHSGSFGLLIQLSDHTAPYGALTASGNASALSNLVRSQSSSGVSPSKLSPKPDPSFPIVPVPPAVLSGLGMLAGIAGIRFVRTRK